LGAFGFKENSPQSFFDVSGLLVSLLVESLVESSDFEDVELSSDEDLLEFLLPEGERLSVA